MVNTVEIFSGHYQGSNVVYATCNEADGTDIVLWKFSNGVDLQIGTGTIGNDAGYGAGYVKIILEDNISIGDILVGYVDLFGKQGGKPVVVYEYNIGVKTGWRNPKLINNDEIPYDTYLQDGGFQIANIYAPEATINNTIPREANPNAKFIDFTIEKEYTTQLVSSVITNVCIVTIKNFTTAMGSPRAKWDGGSLEQVYQKTYFYANNGDHTVEVFAENSNYGSKVLTFNVNIVNTTPTPVVTDIWAASYGINPDSNRTVFLEAYSNRPLESRLLIIGSETFSAMNSEAGSRWNGSYSYNVPAGTYVGEIRIQGTTAVRTIDVRVTF